MLPLAQLEAPGWLAEAAVWIAAVAALAAGAAAAGAWVLVARLRRFDDLAAPLDHLEPLRGAVERIAAERGDLDLRRVEHVLVEVRDGVRRLEDSLVRHAEATRAALAAQSTSVAGSSSLAPLPEGAAGAMLAERAVNRLLALGYERVQLVSRSETLSELGARDGDVLVEARRDGVLHKGRVQVRGGRIADVEMHPAYSIFP